MRLQIGLIVQEVRTKPPQHDQNTSRTRQTYRSISAQSSDLRQSDRNTSPGKVPGRERLPSPGGSSWVIDRRSPRNMPIGYWACGHQENSQIGFAMLGMEHLTYHAARHPARGSRRSANSLDVRTFYSWSVPRWGPRLPNSAASRAIEPRVLWSDEKSRTTDLSRSETVLPQRRHAIFALLADSWAGSGFAPSEL
jgi:hypothetical protein